MQQQVQQQKSDYKFSKGPSRFHNTGKLPGNIHFTAAADILIRIHYTFKALIRKCNEAASLSLAMSKVQKAIVI